MNDLQRWRLMLEKFRGQAKLPADLVLRFQCHICTFTYRRDELDVDGVCLGCCEDFRLDERP